MQAALEELLHSGHWFMPMAAGEGMEAKALQIVWVDQVAGLLAQEARALPDQPITEAFHRPPHFMAELAQMLLTT